MRLALGFLSQNAKTTLGFLLLLAGGALYLLYPTTQDSASPHIHIAVTAGNPLVSPIYVSSIDNTIDSRGLTVKTTRLALGRA
jgi:hypothetical protein